jgi:non-specific serine/threonine protein kinase
MIIPLKIGRYPIIRELGRGGMGVVYLAEDPTLERVVAIKVLPAEVADSPIRLQRFEREAKLLASVSHPNIAMIHSLEREENGTAFLVLELVEGQSLRERLDDGTLPWREALMLGLQIVAALEAAHARGVVHRDLKPANVLVTPDEVVKLIDFGIGRREGDGGDDLAITRQGEMMGTPGYMSPEQVRGESIDRRTDIFTFGCLVYECLCGKKAFGGSMVEARVSAILGADPDWSALPADTPPVVRSLLERCLAKEPSARLQHIAEVRLALEALMFPTNPGLPQAVFSPAPPAGRPHNLPRRLTSFIGRERALQDVRVALEGSALLTLTGTGGCGKTRLALRVAEEMLPAFAGGAWLIELAGVTDPQLVESQVAVVLGVGQEGVGQDTGGQDGSGTKKGGAAPLRALLVYRLTADPTLLVFDNCEHLLGAVADLVSALLAACPDLRILATSREALGIPGEITWRLPSLELPIEEPALSAPVPGDAASKSPATRAASHPAHAAAESGAEARLSAIRGAESVCLFEERARSVVPSFRVETANAEAVARICRRLDGIPLAIELAAAKVRVLTCAEIEAKLSDRFRLLAGGGRGAMERQRTLRGAIDWSYGLLDEDEQRLFRGLSVFAGGWTLEAATAVCGDGCDELDVLDLLARLADKSLVQAEERNEATRHGMLETIREYGREECDRRGESAALRDHHLRFYLELAETAEPHFAYDLDEDPEPWFARLLLDRENFLAAFHWSEFAEGGTDLGLRISLAVRKLLWEKDEHTLVLAMDAELLRRGGGSPLLRAKFLRRAGWVLTYTDIPRAVSLLRESVALARDIGDSRELAIGLRHLAAIVPEAGFEESESSAYLAESLWISRTQGDRDGEARALEARGELLWRANRMEEGRAYLHEAAETYGELGKRGAQARLLGSLGWLAMKQDEDLDAARRYCLESRDLWARFGRSGYAKSAGRRGQLAIIETRAGRFSEARKLIEEAIPVARTYLNPAGMWYFESLLTQLAIAQCDYPLARRHGLLALDHGRRSPYPMRAFTSECALATVALAEGEFEESWSFLGAALARARSVGWRVQAANVLAQQADLALERGQIVESLRVAHESVEASRNLNSSEALQSSLPTLARVMAASGARGEACAAQLEHLRLLPTDRVMPLCQGLEALAEMAARLDEPSRAAWAWGAAQAIREHKGQPLSPHDRLRREEHWIRARDTLGADAFDAAFEEGRALDPPVAREQAEAWLQAEADNGAGG